MRRFSLVLVLVFLVSVVGAGGAPAPTSIEMLLNSEIGGTIVYPYSEIPGPNQYCTFIQNKVVSEGSTIDPASERGCLPDWIRAEPSEGFEFKHWYKAEGGSPYGSDTDGIISTSETLSLDYLRPCCTNYEFTAVFEALASCTLPNGTTIAHGESATLFQSETVPFGSSCQEEIRTCNDETLTGSFEFSSCTIQSCEDGTHWDGVECIESYCINEPENAILCPDDDLNPPTFIQWLTRWINPNNWGKIVEGLSSCTLERNCEFYCKPGYVYSTGLLGTSCELDELICVDSPPAQGVIFGNNLYTLYDLDSDSVACKEGYDVCGVCGGTSYLIEDCTRRLVCRAGYDICGVCGGTTTEVSSC